MEASKPLASDAALRAYVRKIEARAAMLYNDQRPDDSPPWKELAPRDRHEWMRQAKGKLLRRVTHTREGEHDERTGQERGPD